MLPENMPGDPETEVEAEKFASRQGHKPQFGSPVAEYHKWFAWYPVKTWDYRPVWLQTIYRRRIQKHDHLDGGPLSWWEYSKSDEKDLK